LTGYSPGLMGQTMGRDRW